MPIASYSTAATPRPRSGCRSWPTPTGCGAPGVAEAMQARRPLRLLIHTDGAARGNPGPAGAGAILRDAVDRRVVAEVATFLGVRTNNYAEWTAVALAR